MKLLIYMLARDLPVFIREEILSTLFQITAEAFSFRNPRLDGAEDAFVCPLPAFEHLSFDENLPAYALFTRDQAENALRDGRDIREIKQKLYQNAVPLGEKLRGILGAKTIEEVMEPGQILYRAIGVDIQAGNQGSVIVKDCYFSRFYSGAVCDLISALDDGVFSGLSGGIGCVLCWSRRKQKSARANYRFCREE